MPGSEQEIGRRAILLAAAASVGGAITSPRVGGQQNQTSTRTPSEDTPTPTPTETDTRTPYEDTPTQPENTPTPTDTETPTPTDDGWEPHGETPTPKSVEFVQIKYNPRGHDNNYPEDEWVEFRNSGDRANLKGCTISDSENRLYEFGNVWMGRNRTIRVVTGKGRDRDETVYMGYNRAYWNNDGDTFTLRDPDGNTLVRESYSGECESGYHPCSGGSTATPSRTSRPTGTPTPSQPNGGSRSTPEPRAHSTQTASPRRATETRTSSSETSTPYTVGDGDTPTRTPTSTATDPATVTKATTDGNVTEQGAEGTDANGTTADAPGFGALATLGGVAAATAHLLKRSKEEVNNEE